MCTLSFTANLCQYPVKHQQKTEQMTASMVTIAILELFVFYYVNYFTSNEFASMLSGGMCSDVDVPRS